MTEVPSRHTPPEGARVEGAGVLPEGDAGHRARTSRSVRSWSARPRWAGDSPSPPGRVPACSRRPAIAAGARAARPVPAWRNPTRGAVATAIGWVPVVTL
ncbi:hypothetical protein Ae168Ps1_0594c [Pseudonocardia sp. Ae168_Ps1]|nr:hypothetical protein Ae150APs1_0597c [Pseudonocardia sp. Ae150A_Ps1]OLL78188.1 hypothetical protein Ae168Ps1_0594c [Pseudonocardia sp. Ae168_Ps1]OLL87690.1 hypothetical protein Ae263Ps1_4745 [Pseudonocardia sp. Ae263_Ps1]OLL92283.1 hypothetical protein Ae356Ps1_2180c [Pseudonocardia sp. Ae356_Ps1]